MERETTGDGPSPAADGAAHKKHLAMLHRLSHRRPGSEPDRNPDSGSAPDSVPAFLALFSSSKLAVDSDLSRLLSPPAGERDPAAVRSDLDRVAASIADLERLVAQSSYFLPSYELRSSLNSVSDLKETLEKATAQLIPRKKFSFKNKSKAPTPTPLVEEKPDLVSPLKVSDATLPGLRDKKGAFLVKGFRVSNQVNGEFTLSNLDSCEIYLKGKVRALFINKLTNCRVHCGPVLGSILIEDAADCVFMLASHQIRIHQARRTDFYLRVRSRPIVEDCNGVRFGPHRFFYEGLEVELRDARLEEETGNWANVDDFKWLRAVQSPNWCLIPEEELVETVDASGLEDNCGDC